MNLHKLVRFPFKNSLLLKPQTQTSRLLQSSYALSSSFPPCKPFSTTNKKDWETSYGSLITRSDAATSLSKERTESVEDRFHLSQIQDVKKLFSILKANQYSFPLNELIHFLHRIVQLNEQKNLHLTAKNSTELSAFFTEIKKHLKLATQEYPVIGSYAWCFSKLEYDEQELWLTLADHIIDGRFFSNFTESLYAIEGFTVLNGIADQSFIDEVYKRLEKILVLTITEIEIPKYLTITESLLKVNRYPDYVFDLVERHLLHLIKYKIEEYDLRIMLDILATFAMSGNGSEHIYYAFQQIFITFTEQPREVQESLIHGDFISKLVQTYSLARMIQPELVFEQVFRKLVHQLVINKNADYSLEELVNVIEHIHVFEFEEIDQINELLDGRLFQVRGAMKGDDMVKYIDLKVGRDYDGEYKNLPKEIMRFFDDYLNKHMEEQKPNQIYFYFSEIEDRKLMDGKEDVMNHLISYVSQRLHIYDFEDLCYYYWLFNKYNNMINMNSAKIQCDLSQIKDHIRLYSAFSKGRLRIGSNFYKMLEVVSGSDFLTQGEYPEF